MTQNYSLSVLQMRGEAGQKDCQNAFGKRGCFLFRIIVFCPSKATFPVESTPLTGTMKWRKTNSYLWSQAERRLDNKMHVEKPGNREQWRSAEYTHHRVKEITREDLIGPFRDGGKMSGKGIFVAERNLHRVVNSRRIQTHEYMYCFLMG